MNRIMHMHRLMSIGALFIAGLVFARGEVMAQGTDFGSLFRAAITNSAVSRVIVADDFEKGLAQEFTRDPLGNETGFFFNGAPPRLRAYLSGVTSSNRPVMVVSDEQASAGAKSIRLQPLPGVQTSLNWHFYGTDMPRRGQFRMSFDLLNNGTADCDLHIQTFDSSLFRADLKRREQNHFYLLCRRGAARLGGSMGLPQGQWSHFEVDFPLGDPAGKAVLRVTGVDQKLQTTEQPLENIANAISRIAITITGAEGGQVFLDNLVITITE